MIFLKIKRINKNYITIDFVQLSGRKMLGLDILDLSYPVRP